MLSDLTFIEEANPKFVNGNMNSNYVQLVGKKIREFKSYQKRKYNLVSLTDSSSLLSLRFVDNFSLNCLTVPSCMLIPPSKKKSYTKSQN
jgi:hypothetical protein